MLKASITTSSPLFRGFAMMKDDSSLSIYRDYTKCIYCDACVSACEDQGMEIYEESDAGESLPPQVAGNIAIADSLCIGCGQCTIACPVGCLTEKDDTQKVKDAIADKTKIVVGMTAPTVRVGVSETMGLEPGAETAPKLITALKKLGFDYVFDVTSAADLTIMEEGSELLERVKTGGKFPMFTSCCPGWINLVETCYPELIPNLSSCRSPQAMSAALIKSYFAQKLGKNPADIIVVSLMPCTAKKMEIARPQLKTEEGVPETDVVITVREIGRMLKEAGYDADSYTALADTPYDEFLGVSSGAGLIFGSTGGVMEAALRTAVTLTGGDGTDFVAVRGDGEDGVKTYDVTLGDGTELHVAAIHGSGRAREWLESTNNGEGFHFVEVMACPHGCVGGGGMVPADDDVILQRAAGLYSFDAGQTIRKSHENPIIQQLYKDFLGEPLGHLSHKLLHTHYSDRSPKE
ncbi:NADH-ubiquinone oxidoreductase, putative [Aduncisulcus paluster]|uniref:NADH-ubiquinone oxidoreductase, putative n=1 Tax=Aduncisulcus paluster TaxID=2918883 RepID=A0ABQ5JZ22_9EUKA|nr:NADH-ubiquinone oxidoreductase, putative [Aduncisulcus paluster]|eukprot:gnl/Carplike_NY0171/1930_a2610_714.p1 GENE.gnl/Carplike_NY0171/1930_a2610_714~~gnl/Carplike_NY0171/1930_a2610_714.p1  ORF type:complete len:463 (-),score=180.76 gnl/Carplike_NY0171/1930_a2610_714:252-1640(-)